jgi:uncharacterized protein YdaU (DUF1376 family)
MSGPQFMPFYPGDYLRDTNRLTTEGHGAYVLLILDFWSNAQPPPDDDEVLAAITKMPVDRWQKLRPTIAHFFQIDNGFWDHRRIRRELKKAQRLHDVRSKAGSKGRAKQLANNELCHDSHSHSYSPNGRRSARARARETPAMKFAEGLYRAAQDRDRRDRGEADEPLLAAGRADGATRDAGQ